MAVSLGILGILAAVILFFLLFLPVEEWITLLILLGVYMLPGFGKESIVPALLGGGQILEALSRAGIQIQLYIPLEGFPLWIVILGILAVDMTLAVIISFNFDLLLRIPLLGKVLGFFTRKTTILLEKKPWIKGLASAGLFLFMYMPFMGSSAIDTSIIGRMLSIHPKILLPIVFTGSCLATLTLGLGVQAIIQLWMMNPLLAILALAFIAATVVLIWLLWKKRIKSKQEKKDDENN